MKLESGAQAWKLRSSVTSLLSIKYACAMQRCVGESCLNLALLPMDSRMRDFEVEGEEDKFVPGDKNSELEVRGGMYS